MENTIKHEMNMTEGGITWNIIKFVIPLASANVIQYLFNIVDMMIVGRFAGDYAMAAVGDTTYLSGFLLNAFMGLSVGVNVVAARYYAQKDADNLSKTVHTAVCLAVLCGLFLSILGVVFAKSLLVWMNTPVENHVRHMAIQYIQVYFLGAPVILLYYFSSAILRAVGDTKRPLFFIILAGILNVLFNLLFVYKLELGVIGVALGTILAQSVSCVCVIYCLVQERGPIHLDFKKLRMSCEKVKEIVRMGIPACIQQMIFSYANISMQTAVNSFGATVVAGNVAVAGLETMIYSMICAFQNAMITVAGQNTAVGKTFRVKRAMQICGLMAFIFGTVGGNLIVFFGKKILLLYTNSNAIIEVGLLRMKFILTFYGLSGASETIAGTIRGMGYSIVPTISAVFFVLLFRISWIHTVFAYVHTLPSLYLLMPCSFFAYMIGNYVIFTYLYKKDSIGHL
ncbi:MAG: MATE family efflux transporter [Lachnospiraceae bacterium]|nr:MATE family efflux transporter [Lachnospiraceae bacterium]